MPGGCHKNAIDEKKDFDEMREIANTHLDLFIVMKDKTGDQYYETLVSHRKDFDSFEEYLKSKEKFPVYKKTEDMVIQTARNWTVQNFKSNNTLSVYIPLMKKDNPIISIPGDIILQIDLDISEQNLFTQSVITKLAIFIFIHFLMIFLIFYFTIKYQKIQKKLEKENEKNKDLALYNKSFISNMVHQIRTPFSIVMTSTSLLEMFSKKDISKYTSQINVAINSLSNAYENLSYYISSKDLDYPKTQISFSKFLQDRVKFFGQISTVNGKEIITQIESDIELGFNNMELERLLDNNISNCIKFSDFGSKILITFKQTEKKNGLLFQFDSKNFAFNKKLFQDRKDLKLDNSSNTALGVYVIKKICDKYSIDYSLKVEKQRVTFSYYWI
ncbi:MAG: GHKL domain-containing protein [Campylobacterales bacterium]|nr:GHKL domain-containing protein [Campylobacterales bacterium]